MQKEVGAEKSFSSYLNTILMQILRVVLPLTSHQNLAYTEGCSQGPLRLCSGSSHGKVKKEYVDLS